MSIRKHDSRIENKHLSNIQQLYYFCQDQKLFMNFHAISMFEREIEFPSYLRCQEDFSGTKFDVLFCPYEYFSRNIYYLKCLNSFTFFITNCIARSEPIFFNFFNFQMQDNEKQI